MRRNRISKLIVGGLALAAISSLGVLGCSDSALAAPQITLYKDSSPSNPTEISPYDGWSRAEASFSFHIEASDFNTYAVYLSTPDGSLHGSIDGNTDTIDSMDSSSGSKALGAMDANTWGIRYADGSNSNEASTAVSTKEYTAPKVVESGNIVGPTNADLLSSKNGNTTDTITRHYAIDVAATADNTLTPDTYTGTIVLSAIATPRVIAAAGTFQDFTIAKCEAIPKNTTTTLEDSRDGKVYLVSRLEDGNCWMVQNLALEGGTTIDSTDSNLNSGQTYTLPTSSLSFATFDSDTTPHMFNGSHQDGKPDTAGCNSATPSTGCIASSKTGTDNNNSGAYYSWDAATAGKYTSTSSGEATQSICPKNWTLPSSNKANTVDKSFNKLYAGAVGSGYASNKTSFDTAWRPGYGGILIGNSLDSSGAYSGWWSTTISDGSSAYNLSENDSNDVYTSGSVSRRYGRSVRCVFDATMQNFTTNDCSKLTTNKAIALKDTRDDKRYLVSKLADDNCWMVQNLSLWGSANGTTKTVKAYNWYTKELYDYQLPASSTTGFSDNNAQNMYNGSYQPATYNTNGNDGSGASGKDGANSGSYYSWLTAIAQPASPVSLPVNNASTTSYTPPTGDGGQVYTSICPKGWRLPTSGNSSANGEFEQLAKAYGASSSSNDDTFNDNGTFNAVWNPTSTYTGVFYNSALVNSSLGSGWWSGTTKSDTSAYRLIEEANILYPRNDDYRRVGNSIRCVLAS